MTANHVNDSVYADAARDLEQGRETAATKKVRFEARTAMVRGAHSENVKRNLIRKGMPEALACRIVAEEFAKAQPELENNRRSANRDKGWAQLGACMVILYFLGKSYPLLQAGSGLRMALSVVTVGAIIGVLGALYKGIFGK